MRLLNVFSYENAKDTNSDVVFASIDDYYEPYIDKDSVANACKYGLYIYDDTSEMTDEEYENRTRATMLFSDDRDSFILGVQLISAVHINSNDLTPARYFLYTYVPEDKVFRINALTVNGREIESNLEFKNFDQMYNAYDTIDKIITSPVAEME